MTASSFMALPARFERRGTLGTGSMGHVERVYDRELEIEVALKVLPGLDPIKALHLKDEFRAVRDIGHPNIADLHELFAQDSLCFFTMEIIQGVPVVEALADTIKTNDEERARHIVDQIVDALQSLHGHGLVHRDIKPSNVLVAANDRAVLLDFGVAALGYRPIEHGYSGTYAYLAPEALFGQQTEAADWFALGAVLFESLVGRLPWDADDPLMQPRQADPDAMPAKTWPWLRTLILQLLSKEPSHRIRRTTPNATFVGRQNTLGVLWKSWEGCLAGTMEVVEITAPSGFGKTSTLTRFVRGAQDANPCAVLRGGCHPSEHVRFRALDPIVADLIHVLLSPTMQGVLVQTPPPLATNHAVALFPALTEVLGVERGTHSADPTEQARQAVRGLSELLRWVSTHVPLIVIIDDVQWADDDSARIVRSLMGTSTAARILWLISTRPQQGPFSEMVSSDQRWTDGVRIDLGRLGDGDIQEIIEVLAPGCCTPELIQASDGVPFLAAELARSVRELGGSSLEPSELISRRIGSLSEPEQSLLTVMAVAGRPMRRSMAQGVAQLGPDLPLVVRSLERRGLVQRGADFTLSVSHAKIRSVLLERVSDERVTLHSRVADSLAMATERDPDWLLEQLLAAERRDEAAPVARQAAARADSAFDFVRAAELFQLALDLGVADDERGEVLFNVAQSLRHAGRDGDAGDAFARAAEANQDVNDYELLTQAAHCWVRCGRTQEGVELFSKLLGREGVRLPATDRKAMFLGLWTRLRFVLRGWRHTPGETVSVDTERRFDLLWKALNSLALTRYPLSFYLSGRLLMEALRAGHVNYISQSLGMQATFEASIGGKWLLGRAERQLQVVQHIALHSHDPILQVLPDSYGTVVAWNAAQWANSRNQADRFLERHRTKRILGQDWAKAVVSMYSISSRYFLGEYRAGRRMLREILQSAVDRDDMFAANMFRLGDVGMHNLAAHDLDTAQRNVSAAEATMQPGPGGDHYFHSLFSVQLALYMGDAPLALRRMDTAWPLLEKGQFLGLANVRCQLHFLRARARIAAAGAAGVKDVRRSIKTIRKVDLPHAKGYALQLQAAITTDNDTANAAWLRAAAAYDEAAMVGFSAVCRHRAATVSGHDDALQQAEGQLRKQGVVRPDLWIATLAPKVGAGE